jgi:alanyl-tRNA synthetase
LGNHVEQKGSLVNDDYLRFDFSHFSKLSNEELFSIENKVNQYIRDAIPLNEERNVPMDLARKKGAIMLFGEKYGDSVRVIQFGDSVELCGGLHVSNTANIGNFKFSSESSISSGIRRIEAVSGTKADEIINNKLSEYNSIAEALKNPQDLLSAVKHLQLRNLTLEKKLDAFNNLKLKEIKKDLIASQIKFKSFNMMDALLDLSADEMKQIAFEIKGEIKNFVLLLSSNKDNKPFITLMISEDLVKDKDWNAGLIIRELAKEIKGGGGGQPFFATAGGSNIDGLKNVIKKAKMIFNE